MAIEERYRKESPIEDKIIKIKERILDLVFPRRCVVCDEPTDDPKKGVCRACRSKIVYIKDPFCMKCGKQLKQKNTEYCEDCQKRRHLWVQGTSLYDYGSMADSIFRFKYSGRQEYAEFYGYDMYRQKKSWLRAVQPDALVPVPIHAARKRRRGYNQAQLIAEVLSRHCDIPVCNELITRVKKTKPQKNLTEQERQNNLKKAFKILQNDVKLSTIVIIDDIYTTGSTIDAMTEILYSSGIGRIYHMTLAAGRGI